MRIDYHTEFTLEREIKEDAVSIDILHVLEIIVNNLDPEDVFSDDDLKQWALDNGFVEGE